MVRLWGVAWRSPYGNGLEGYTRVGHSRARKIYIALIQFGLFRLSAVGSRLVSELSGPPAGHALVAARTLGADLRCPLRLRRAAGAGHTSRVTSGGGRQRGHR